MDAPPANPSHDNSSSSDMDDEEDDEEEDDEDDEAANGYLAQITEVTLGGDRPASEVQELVAGIGEWLTHQPEDKHRDLRSAQLLLYKVVKRRGDKAKFEDMRISHDKLQAQLEDAEKSNDELQIAVEKLDRRCKDVETEVEALLIELKEARGKRIEQRTQYADLERRYEDSMHDWNLKYERCLKENREYRELLGTIRPDLLSSPPKIPRNNIYAEASVVEPQAMTTEDRRPSGSPPTSKNRQSIFALSPVPATLPMPAISSIHATFSSPAEDSDAEEIRKVPSHTPRSVQPIPIKSNGYRHGSNLRESEVPRSIPRSLVDVHMASCSSSPVVSDLNSGVSDTVSEKERMQSSLLQRPTQGISRASTAAMQAERARQEKLSAALAPPPPIGPVYKDAGLQRDISNTYYGQQPQQQYGRPPFSRRPSDTTRGKPPTSHPTNPSALTRSLWTAESQHAQRV
ncbi:hypothetical protein EUX98_g2536 [Antrodiella citrinella]|uniref:Uncharacterized protein n=1 Tax=Antrodiella citrinella TaxID=2447956 RepID=A0A4S4N712_9APHY|nr:hypothetical protein EUX98_g2536 [Antrodiella citrinella]